MEQQQVHVRAVKVVPRRYGFLRRVNHSEIDNGNAALLDLFVDFFVERQQPLAQAGELWPIGVQPNAEQSDCYVMPSVQADAPLER